MGRSKGDRELGQRGCSEAAVVRQRQQSHIRLWQIKIGRDTCEASHPSPSPDCATQCSSARNKASLLLAVKTSGIWGGKRNCWFFRRVHLKDSQVLECTQTHPLWESAPGQQLEGCQLHTGSGGSDWKWGESQASGIVPFQTPPPRMVPQSGEVGCPTLMNT